MAEVHIPVHKGAEAFSFWTHGIGMLAAIVGLVLLVIRASGGLAITATAIYGGTLVLLLFSSTLHHAVQSAHAKEKSGFLRRLDHVSIFLFIAGTYTPVCLLGLPSGWGISILSVVWGLALAGVAVKLFAPFTPRWITSGLYILLGWVVIVGVKPLWDAFSGEGLWMLGLGGVVYTVGAVGYAMKKPDVWPQYVGFHGIWHVMVLIGAGLHFAFIALHVPYVS